MFKCSLICIERFLKSEPNILYGVIDLIETLALDTRAGIMRAMNAKLLNKKKLKNIFINQQNYIL